MASLCNWYSLILSSSTTARDSSRPFCCLQCPKGVGSSVSLSRVSNKPASHQATTSSNEGITSARSPPYCRGSLLVVSTSEFHCRQPWFDQNEGRQQSCNIHPASRIDELEELRRSGVFQRQSFHISCHVHPAQGIDELQELRRSGVFQRQSFHVPSLNLELPWITTPRSLDVLFAQPQAS